MMRFLVVLSFFLTFLFLPHLQATPEAAGRAPHALSAADGVFGSAVVDSIGEDSIGEDASAVQTDELAEATELLAEEPVMPAVVSDSIYIARLRRLHSVIDLPFNSIVRRYIQLYTEDKRDKAEAILGLSEYYFPIFEQILDQYGMPLELRYLAVIESALNPRIVSRAGATGLWQFMYGTGRMYGLTVTSTVDDRCDPIKATHAAARHLRDLYNMFDDWTLAIAAYNCGAGSVRKAIRRSGRNDFWGIYHYLPRETRGYVPAFIGAAYMMSYSKEHGLMTPKYDFKKYYSYDTVHVQRWMHFDQIAAALNIPLATLRDLNPQYRRDIVPGNERTCTLKLPVEYINTYIDNDEKIALHLADKYNPKTMLAPAQFTAYVPQGKTKVVYKVQKGDVLGAIAARYGVRVQDLKQWNALRSNYIRVGQRLNVYVSPAKAALYAAQKTSPQQNGQAAVSGQQKEFLYYQVKQGDTLWSISQQYKYLGITPSDLMSLNNMSNTTKIMPGQTIKIKKIG
ncbi:MAG: LysM peptidoglycan-binding domain-containing protein [Prevotellaceae bacterium]|jgi:membrane-bound lytic murein transglycosylase D|nr:LysM peptidoglycan-binding domain-containing protein [Prevotellaceae bacterium]